MKNQISGDKFMYVLGLPVGAMTEALTIKQIRYEMAAESGV
jgi:hypothetical protein